MKNPKQKEIVAFVLATIMFTCAHLAAAQQVKKIPRLGYLSRGLSQSVSGPNIMALRQSLRQLGYLEKENVIIDWRFANGKLERLPVLAAELVGLKVNLIVAQGNPAARAARQETSTIPIIVISATSPIENNLFSGFAYPGANVTGLTNYSHELNEKRIEILKGIVPKAVNFGLLHSGNASDLTTVLARLKLVAQAFRIKLEPIAVFEPNDIESAFLKLNRQRVDAVVVQGDSVFIGRRHKVIELANKDRLPAIYAWSAWVVAGGLSSYGPNDLDQYRRAAVFVDKILRGTKPADLPVEQPKKFELVINLKAAQNIGLRVPDRALRWADEVIR